MTRAYATLAFTPEVMAAQAHWGTGHQTAAALQQEIEPHDALTPAAQAFAAQVNTAFIATVGTSGWPYVQHRGGARGFIRVLDAGHLLIPDVDGNGQLITVGNLSADGRAMLILMDYAARRRLKLWGHARVLQGADRERVPDWGEAPRALLFDVAAMNFNCPANIPTIEDKDFPA